MDGEGARLAKRPGEASTPRLERSDRVVFVRSLAAGRQVLRERRLTTQAGFTAEFIPKGYLKHHPILIADGPGHDAQRTKVGRFFAPKVVAERYSATMDDEAGRLLRQAQAQGSVRLDQLALEYSVAVTAQVVGLTDSPVTAMARRLVTFFNQPPFDITRPDLGRTPGQWARAAVNGLVPIVRFWWADVRPAVRARRRRPRTDVISHLIGEGYTDLDILVECVTYGTAGMVTTREFIVMAAWHLIKDPTLGDRYRRAGQAERLAILHEIIRLEPVVGHLYRRAQGPFTIEDQGQSVEVTAGDLIDVCVRAANVDAEAVGEDPLQLCPGRELPPGVDATGLAFGDGAHRCPGQPLAILESDAFLTRLLALGPRIVTEPRLGWDDLIAGYWLRNFDLTFEGPDAPVTHPAGP